MDIVHISSSVSRESIVVSVIVTIDTKITPYRWNVIHITGEYKDTKLFFDQQYLPSCVDNIIDGASIVVIPSQRLLIEPGTDQTRDGYPFSD
ncbi:MAG: hypothetical protein LBH02_00405 [Methanocalculaceae archaeon]|jgi:hypothetical protein|nr:hypothetical protein [Methanocalculaceae archaeon]